MQRTDLGRFCPGKTSEKTHKIVCRPSEIVASCSVHQHFLPGGWYGDIITNSDKFAVVDCLLCSFRCFVIVFLSRFRFTFAAKIEHEWESEWWNEDNNKGWPEFAWNPTMTRLESIGISSVITDSFVRGYAATNRLMLIEWWWLIDGVHDVCVRVWFCMKEKEENMCACKTIVSGRRRVQFKVT